MLGFGEQLREARERRGLSLEQVEQATKIRRRTLEALEREALGELPPPFYAQGLLRSYGTFLGLDPTLLPPLPKAQQTISPPRLEAIWQLQRPPRGIWSLLTVGALLLLFVFGGMYLYQGNQNQGKQLTPATATQSVFELPPIPPTPTPPPTPLPTPTSTPQPRVSPTPNPTPPTQEPLRIKVPQAVGLPSGEAERLMAAGGLKVRQTEQWNDRIPQGIVVQQDPAAETLVPLGSTITLVVSRGTQGIAIPDVVGLPERQAMDVLKALGLRVSPWVSYQGHAELPDQLLRQVCVGCILSTTPPKGTTVTPGTEVFVAVRKD